MALGRREAVQERGKGNGGGGGGGGGQQRVTVSTIDSRRFDNDGSVEV